MKKYKNLFKPLLCLVLILGMLGPAGNVFAQSVSSGEKNPAAPPAEKEEIIKEVTIERVTEPKASSPASVELKNLYVVPEGVAATKGQWKDLATGQFMEPDSLFKAGGEYEIFIEVATNKNFAFPKEVKEFHATINGKEATVSDYSEKKVTLSLKFPKIPEAQEPETPAPPTPYVPGNNSNTGTTPTPSTPPAPTTPTPKPTPEVTTVPFGDVEKGDWFIEDVAYVTTKGIMKGTGNQMFSPRVHITRSMIATMLHRLAGTPKPEGSKDFMDNEKDAWFTDSLKWAAEKGLASDFVTDYFQPGNDLTRQQMVTMLYKYAKLQGKNMSATADLTGFTDNKDLSEYAVTPMKWAIQHGIIKGTDGNKLMPEGSTSRAETAAIFKRFMEMK